MTFKDKYSIIIKFTENDNIASEEGALGWVDYFEQFLVGSLKYQVAGEINVTRKSETDLISAAEFEQSDLVFYILSPAFIFSSNINQEAELLEKAFDFNIAYLNGKLKKVFKAPIKIEALPLSLSTPTYYSFFERLENSSNEYSTYAGWSKYQQNNDYWNVFADVISDTLRLFSKEKNDTKAKIFISNSSENYLKHRNNIKRELKAFDIEIFPDEEYSLETNYMEDPSIFFIEKSDLALHFPDEFLGLTAEKRSAHFTQLPEKTRFIWFDPTDSLVPEKKAKYDELKVQLKPFLNIEAIETPIEELKTIIKTSLLKPKIKQKETTTQKEILYIISDTVLTDDVKNEIFNDSTLANNFEIKILSSVQNVSEYRNMHYDLLKRADRFVIGYFKNNEEWLKSMVSEIRKAPGFNRKKEIKGKYIITSAESIVSGYKEQQFEFIKQDRPEKIALALSEIL